MASIGLQRSNHPWRRPVKGWTFRRRPAIGGYALACALCAAAVAVHALGAFVVLYRSARRDSFGSARRVLRDDAGRVFCGGTRWVGPAPAHAWLAANQKDDVEVLQPVTETATPRLDEGGMPEEAAKGWWEETVEFWEGLEVWNAPSIEQDTAPEAVAVVSLEKKIEDMNNKLEGVTEKRSYLREKADAELGRELNKMPMLVFAYWQMRFNRIASRKVVQKGFVSFGSILYFLVVVFFFRSLVPRLLAVQTMDDLFSAASDIGIPSRNNLVAAIKYLQDFDLLPKIGLYTAAFILEKLTLISEILPVQVGLKTIAPILFGGLIPGALISATCETVGAVCNFFIGRVLITERLKSFELFGSGPVGEAPWYAAVSRAAKEDGLRLVLLLRLAHVLPIPFDSYWYILGALPVAPLEFVTAHWVGCLKTAFLDASLGSLLLATATLEAGQKQQLIFAETAGFAIVAALVSSIATRLANDLLGLEEKSDADEPEQVADGPPSGKPTSD